MRDFGEPVLHDDLAKKLFNSVKTNGIYDEVGNSEFGWFGLIIHRHAPYIVSLVKGNFSYKEFPSERAAKKAWDHICIRYERWFRSKNE